MDRELDMHVALDFAATEGIDVFLGRFGDDGVAVVVEPIDQRPDRREFLILDDGRVVEGAEQRATGLEFAQEALVVDVEPERPRGAVKIGPSMKSAILAGGDDILGGSNGSDAGMRCRSDSG
jgi:hypothetical protein